MRKASHPEVRGTRTRASHASRPACVAVRSRSPGDAAGGSDLESEIDEIERLSLDDLRIRWRNLSGRLAPAHLSRGLLARILAYRVQTQACGDLDRNTIRALERWSEPVGHKEPGGQAKASETHKSVDISSAPQRRVCEPLILKPGTLLTREWQGRIETVMVVADGFAWNGEIFASLSAVAQAITGTKWNGHQFFGVRPRDRSLRSPREASDPPVQLKGDGKVRTAGPRAFRNRRSEGSIIAPSVSAVTP